MNISGIVLKEQNITREAFRVIFNSFWTIPVSYFSFRSCLWFVIQILNHILTVWREDRSKALDLLQVPTNQILSDARAPEDLMTTLREQGIDQLVLRDADPALAMNLLQVLCDSYVFLTRLWVIESPAEPGSGNFGVK